MGSSLSGIFLIFTICNTQTPYPLLTWNTNTVVMPTGAEMLFSGYDSSTDRIWLVGDNIWTYNITDNSFTDYGALNINLGTVDAQSSVQWDNSIFFVSEGVLRQFSFNTKQVTPFSTTLGHYDEAPCVAALYPYFIFAIGGIKVGGSADGQERKHMQIYSVNGSDIWYDGPDMQNGRGKFACIVHSNYLFVFGGIKLNSELDPLVRDASERIYIGDMPNITSYTWEFIEYIANSNTYYQRAVVHTLYNQIYLVGGRDSCCDNSGTASIAIQIYDTSNTNLTLIDSANATLNTGRSSPAVILVDNKLYVFGGSATNTKTIYNTYEISDVLTFSPTPNPTISPTHNPTLEPTFIPTKIPSQNPTIEPTHNPTHSPTFIPTNIPTQTPSQPSISPSNIPSIWPTISPISPPTLVVVMDKGIDTTHNDISTTFVTVQQIHQPSQNILFDKFTLMFIGLAAAALIFICVVIVLCIVFIQKIKRTNASHARTLSKLTSVSVITNTPITPTVDSDMTVVSCEQVNVLHNSNNNVGYIDGDVDGEIINEVNAMHTPQGPMRLNKTLPTMKNIYTHSYQSESNEMNDDEESPQTPPPPPPPSSVNNNNSINVHTFGEIPQPPPALPPLPSDYYNNGKNESEDSLDFVQFQYLQAEINRDEDTKGNDTVQTPDNDKVLS